MAKLTSHTLNGSDGTHAADIAVTLVDLNRGTQVLASVMDAGGRFAAEIPADTIDPQTIYELVFDTGPYWEARGTPARVQQIALRFTMPNPKGAYHMPVILSPNSYSVWVSS